MKALFITRPIIMEPLGLMYLSAAAKKAGHKVELALANTDLESKIESFKPDVIGYSVITGNQKFYLDLNNRLKEKFQFKSLFGGPHPTFFPELIEQKGVDIICRGEGEEAFVELLDTLQANADISQISNLYVKQSSGIVKNEIRKFNDINSLAFADRELLQTTNLFHNPIKHFIASRGCPFNCSYCFNEEYSLLYAGKGSRVRFRTPDSVVKEIKQTITSSPTKFVYFQDDTFTLNSNWLKEFSGRYAKEITLPFHCHIRANTLDETRAKYLAHAGCYSVHIALETANDRIRNEILARNMSQEQVVTASDLLKENKIRFLIQNIIGLPTGTIEDDLSTLELNIKCKPDYSWVSIFQPYPGTRLGEYCKKNNLYTGNFEDLESNFFDSSKLNFSEEYKSQLSNLQKLFALFVEYPDLHKLGLSKVMINADRTPKLIDAYRQAYLEFRKKADERLFGFSLCP